MNRILLPVGIMFCLTQSVCAQEFNFSSKTFEVHETAGQSQELLVEVTRTGSLGTGARVSVTAVRFGTVDTAATLSNSPDTYGEVSWYAHWNYRNDPRLTVQFAPGQTTASARFQIHDDDEVESDETFLVILELDGYGKLGPIPSAVVTIRDDESPSTAPLQESPYGLQIEDQTLTITGTDFAEDFAFGPDIRLFDYFRVHPHAIYITTPALSMMPFPIPNARDFGANKVVVIAKGGNDHLTYVWDGLGSLQGLAFDGGPKLVSDELDSIVLRLDSNYDTSTTVISPGELSATSNQAAFTTFSGRQIPATTFVATATNCELIDAACQVGGEQQDGLDAVFVFDSPGDDEFVINANGGTLKNAGQPFDGGYEIRVAGYDRTVVYGSTGSDTATLNDSRFDEDLIVTPSYARMTGVRPNPFDNGLNNTDFDNYVAGFDTIFANASLGFDTANIYDSAGNDVYTGTPEFGEMDGDDYYVKATGFDSIAAFSHQGNDVADLYDSDADDYFVGRQSTSAMFAKDRAYAHTLKFFESVDAISDAGGNDEAQLYGTTGNDCFFAEPTSARFETPRGFKSLATGFAKVIVATGGGIDQIRQRTGLTYFLHRFGNWLDSKPEEEEDEDIFG